MNKLTRILGLFALLVYGGQFFFALIGDGTLLKFEGFVMVMWILIFAIDIVMSKKEKKKAGHPHANTGK